MSLLKTKYLKRPRREEYGLIIRGIKQNLEVRRRHVDACTATAIDSIMVTTGCDHACSFCGFSTPPIARGTVIYLETINKAKRQIGMSTHPDIIGGEPLDHQNIAEICDTTNGTIVFTNGISRQLEPEEYTDLLNAVSRYIRAVTFSIHDKHKGANTGRDILLKHATLTREHPYEIKFVAEPGRETELSGAWLDTMAMLICDEQVKQAIRHPLISRYISELPGILMLSGLYEVVEKIGRGVGLNGLYRGRELGTPYPIMGMPGSYLTTSSLLLPDGALLSTMLTCFASRPMNVYAHIDDGNEVATRKLKELLQRFFSEELGKGNDESESEIMLTLANEELRLQSTIAWIRSLLDQEIKEKLRSIKEAIAEARHVSVSSFRTLADVTEDELECKINCIVQREQITWENYLSGRLQPRMK